MVVKEFIVIDRIIGMVIESAHHGCRQPVIAARYMLTATNALPDGLACGHCVSSNKWTTDHSPQTSQPGILALSSWLTNFRNAKQTCYAIMRPHPTSFNGGKNDPTGDLAATLF